MTARNHKVVKRLITVAAIVVVFGAILFAAAGTFDYPRGWAYLGLSFFMLVLNAIVILYINPDVIAARADKGEITEDYEKVARVFIGVAMWSLPLLAGLDAMRFGAVSFGDIGFMLGTALVVIGYALIIWTMAENTFLEQIVRVQEERDHHVIKTGPYRFVRHPMYSATIVLYIGAPLMLGSQWAFLATALMALTFVVRIQFEEKTLHEQLQGYSAYLQTTKSRLCPGLW